jgi:hypothetical protein
MSCSYSWIMKNHNRAYAFQFGSELLELLELLTIMGASREMRFGARVDIPDRNPSDIRE